VRIATISPSILDISIGDDKSANTGDGGSLSVYALTDMMVSKTLVKNTNAGISAWGYARHKKHKKCLKTQEYTILLLTL